MKTITIEELLQLDQDTITVLDVRPADAYTRGSVPGAVSIPLAEVVGGRPMVAPTHAIRQGCNFSTVRPPLSKGGFYPAG